MIKYTLSNRQRNELLVRGRPLRIAIPVYDLEEDPLQWAADALGDDHDWISDAVHGCICVKRCSGSGMNYWLGRIVDWEPNHLSLSVNVVLATLTPPRPRHPARGPMWPGNAFINGKSIEELKQEFQQRIPS